MVENCGLTKETIWVGGWMIYFCLLLDLTGASCSSYFSCVWYSLFVYFCQDIFTVTVEA